MKRLTMLAVVLFILLMAVLVGCIGSEKEIRTVEGNIKIKEGVGPDWCKAGSSISFTSSQGQTGVYIIEGITTYKGKEMCKAVLDSEDMIMTQYFDENAENVVFIMEDKKTGKTQEMYISK